jgi:transmembrane 9 superfamily member 2/4
LPAASILDTDQYVSTQYVGYPVGYVDGANGYALYNHVNIIIEYHEIDEDAFRIVGFYVEPLSIKHTYNGEWDGRGERPQLTSCSPSKHLTYDDIKNSHQKVAKGKLVFSYGVEWRRSEVHWASRWDIYLTMNGAVPDKVHWFSIVNSILIVLFLAFMVAMILVRALYRDISKYNRVSSSRPGQVTH